MKNLLNEKESLLLIIDIQDKLLNAQPKADDILKKTKKLAQMAEILNIPTVVTEQYPSGLGSTNEELKNLLPENTEIVEKTAFSPFLEDNFEDMLEEKARNQIILCGVETHVCVHQTAYDLIRNGYQVYLVQDACGSRDKKEHKNGLELMRENNVSITTLETVLFELLKTSKHPNFKEIQALIK